jgi:hypothetical protein
MAMMALAGCGAIVDWERRAAAEAAHSRSGHNDLVTDAAMRGICEARFGAMVRRLGDYEIMAEARRARQICR